MTRRTAKSSGRADSETESKQLNDLNRMRQAVRELRGISLHAVSSRVGPNQLWWAPRQRSSPGMFRSSQNLVVSLSSHTLCTKTRTVPGRRL